jgi:DNA polymerase I
VRTILGRLRHLPDISSSDSSKRSQSERQAVNSIIQGSASDLIKYAMLCVEGELDALNWPVNSRPHAVMQIHDELVYTVEREREADFVRLLQHNMEVSVREGLGISVPLITNIRSGENWGSLVDLHRSEAPVGTGGGGGAESRALLQKRNID